MELEGIAIDAKALEEYGGRLMGRLVELEQKIYDEAGEEFNINSPKQLGLILFEKMGMPVGGILKCLPRSDSPVPDFLRHLPP